MGITTDGYKQPKEYPVRQAPKCPASTVVPVLAEIVIEGVVHAGSITHVCSLPEGHVSASESGQEFVCKCQCGYRWVRNFK